VRGVADVLRGELAWSPDVRPIGGNVAGGEAFWLERTMHT